MDDNKDVLIEYNSLFFSEGRKGSLGNIYFIFDDLKYLFLMHFISNQDVDYFR